MLLMEVEMLTDEMLFDKEYFTYINIVGEELYDSEAELIMEDDE